MHKYLRNEEDVQKNIVEMDPNYDIEYAKRQLGVTIDNFRKQDVGVKLLEDINVSYMTHKLN